MRACRAATNAFQTSFLTHGVQLTPTSRRQDIPAEGGGNETRAIELLQTFTNVVRRKAPDARQIGFARPSVLAKGCEDA